jgi:hypothetical protein
MLHRWGIAETEKCPHCAYTESAKHMLCSCTHAGYTAIRTEWQKDLCDVVAKTLGAPLAEDIYKLFALDHSTVKTQKRSTTRNRADNKRVLSLFITSF